MATTSYPDCPCCGVGIFCPGCVRSPLFLHLTVMGIGTQPTFPCAPCAQLNGSYLLTFQGFNDPQTDPNFPIGCPRWSTGGETTNSDFSGCHAARDCCLPQWSLIGCCGSDGFPWADWQLWSNDSCIAILTYKYGCPAPFDTQNCPPLPGDMTTGGGPVIPFNCADINHFCYPCPDWAFPQFACNCDYVDATAVLSPVFSP
jgi:hypothetical protein